MADTIQSLACWEEKLEPHERNRRMVASCKQIANLPSEATRRDYDIFNVRLYENNPMVQLYDYAGGYWADADTLQLPVQQQSKNNRAKAAIDTLHAQVCTTDQRARFLLVDGRSKQARRARALQEFTDGLVHELKLHKLRKRAGKDAAILESGRGGIQFYRDANNRCAAQRVLATEFSIDPRDGMVDGQWKTMYRDRPVPRDQVMATFGDTEERRLAIAEARAVATGGVGDYIRVFECWHLAASKKSGDGWHLVGLDSNEPGASLVCDSYKKTSHEVIWFGWEDRFTTGWGLSLMTQARDLQIGINANTYRIDRGQKLFHAGHLYVNRAAQVNKSALSNEIGTVWEGNGDTPPQKLTFQAVAPELYEQVERDGARIFENLGISTAAAQAETNSGLNESGAAKREEKQKSDQRNADRQQRWEEFLLDCVRAALGVVRDIVTESADGKKHDPRSSTSGYKVAVPGERGLTVMDWKDVATDEDDYVLKIKSASPIPTDPEGLVAFGERMVEIGAWKPSELAGYMQDLDQDGRVNRQMAQERQMQAMFESLLYDDISAAMPDEFTNLAMALELGSQYLAQGMDDGVSEKHLERVRRYLRRCSKMAPPPAEPAAEAPVAAVA